MRRIYAGSHVTMTISPKDENDAAINPANKTFKYILSKTGVPVLTITTGITVGQNNTVLIPLTANDTRAFIGKYKAELILFDAQGKGQKGLDEVVVFVKTVNSTNEQ